MRHFSYLIFIVPAIAWGSLNRISSNHQDLSKVEKIFVSPGLVSMVEFPQNIIEVRVGSPETLKAVISQVSPKELTLYLSSSAASPSNLIVRSEKRIFVFDIVPSKSNHQDYIKIRGAYGAPESSSRLRSLAEGKIIPESKNNSRSSQKLKNTKVVKVSP